VVAAVIPPILLVRLRSHQPDGTRVGERDRTCHVVPAPDSDGVPEVLRAYCGTPILPGTADLLDGVTGMPCQNCLARSPIPAFAMLRTLPTTPPGPAQGSRPAPPSCYQERKPDYLRLSGQVDRRQVFRGMR
jgi:hypothetical protein